VAFSLVYLGLCRALSLVASSRRCQADKDVELVVLRHQVRALERQLHGRVRYRRVDRAILPPSAGSSLATAGKRSLSLRPRCCAGTDKPDDASGELGGGREAQGGRRLARSW
jgi:hypothetical protein